MRAAGSGSFNVRAPPKRASGDLCLPLTKTYMDVGNPEVFSYFRIARQPSARLFLRFFFQVLEPVRHYIDLVFGAGDVGLAHRYQTSIRSDRVTRRNLLVLEQ